MEIKSYSPAEQVDPAVDLGAIPPPLPEIIGLRELAEAAPMPPPQLIDGVLHQGCKMVLSGTSKSNKSWCLLDLAVSVASGQNWWGRTCRKAPVLYINFELHDWAIAQRLIAICGARPECKGMAETLKLWNLRGRNADLSCMGRRRGWFLLGDQRAGADLPRAKEHRRAPSIFWVLPQGGITPLKSTRYLVAYNEPVVVMGKEPFLVNQIQAPTASWQDKSSR